MPTLRKYNVFISHAWDHNDDYYRCEKFLNEAAHFSWKNLSVPEHGAVLARAGKVIGEAFRGELCPGEHPEFTLLEKKPLRSDARRRNPFYDFGAIHTPESSKDCLCRKNS